MKTVILSPHVDDAIFSLGDYIQALEDVTIMSIFSGIPGDSVGMQKHLILRKEHEMACLTLGADYINADFFDDVYQPRPTMRELSDWIRPRIADFDSVIAPLGIFHPDHELLSAVMRTYFKVDKYYMELPYGTLYPHLLEPYKARYNLQHTYRIFEGVTGLKKKAVSRYASQLQNDHILGEILVPEELYD